MPKHLLRCRPSGLHARYWIPLALREAAGPRPLFNRWAVCAAVRRVWKPPGLGMLWLIGLPR